MQNENRQTEKIENDEITREQLLKMLTDLIGKDTHWNVYANAFVRWLLKNPDSKTFQKFLKWTNTNRDVTWNCVFLWPYTFELFCRDWVARRDRRSFREFCIELEWVQEKLAEDLTKQAQELGQD
jgi:hypothetical protein